MPYASILKISVSPKGDWNGQLGSETHVISSQSSSSSSAAVSLDAAAAAGRYVFKASNKVLRASIPLMKPA